jgi:hypothetical protein
LARFSFAGIEDGLLLICDKDLRIGAPGSGQFLFLPMPYGIVIQDVMRVDLGGRRIIKKAWNTDCTQRPSSVLAVRYKKKGG